MFFQDILKNYTLLINKLAFSSLIIVKNGLERCRRRIRSA